MSNPDLFISRFMLFLPVLLGFLVTGAGVALVQYGFKRMRATNAEGPGGWLFQAILFIAVIDLILFAGLDVGQFLVLFTEGWGGIVGVCATLFAPWLGYKAVGKITASRGGPTTLESGKD